MKKYIILTPSICFMGGAEEYINQKVNYLEQKGFETYVFSSRRGEVFIPNFERFIKNIIHTLGLPPFVYSRRFIKKTITRLLTAINYQEGDNVYIESTAISMNLWGELLAERIKSNHVIIDLQEKHNYPLYIQEFLFFKYKRNELFGIKKDSIYQIFSLICGDYEPRYISAACTDVVSDVKCDIEICKADYNICSIGRLDKPFVMHGCQEVVKFANSHSDKKINMCFIGGGSATRISEIRNTIKEAKNINLIITGYLYPIPYCILKKMDCFFSSAGSSWVSAKLGYPTVSISTEGDALGILFYTTMESVFKPKDYLRVDLSKYLEMILIDGYCLKNEPVYKYIKFDKEKEFDRQLSFFSSSTNQYYDVLGKAVLTKKEKIYRCMSHIFGGYIFESIQHFLHILKTSKK